MEITVRAVNTLGESVGIWVVIKPGYLQLIFPDSIHIRQEGSFSCLRARHPCHDEILADSEPIAEGVRPEPGSVISIRRPDGPNGTREIIIGTVIT